MNTSNFSLSYSPKSLMFGTFQTHSDKIKLGTNGIELNGVRSDYSINNTHKYDIKIPFKQMVQLLYCFDKYKPSLFIKPSLLSNHQIQKCLFSQIEPRVALKFDVNSSDVRENYIKVLFSNRLTKPFVDFIKNWSIISNKDIDFNQINIINASYLMNIIISRSTIYENYFKTSVVDKQKAQEIQSTSSLNQSLKTRQNDVKSTDDLIVMFGTFRAEVKKVMFDSICIKLIDVFESNSYKNIIIPFKQINYLLYCIENSQISLFVRPKPEFNDEIKRSMNILSNDFDKIVDYITVVFKERIARDFSKELKVKLISGFFSVNNLEISASNAEHLIECAKVINQLIYCNSNYETIDTYSQKLIEDLTKRRIEISKSCQELKEQCFQQIRNEWFCPNCRQKCVYVLSNSIEMISLNCGHVFCGSCFNVRNGVKKECPTCRKPIISEDSYLRLQI